ncbi:MAG: MAC/perforin domain-containing protein, partial [Gemmatimonadota bacterium]
QTQVIDSTSESEFSATQNTHLEVYGGRSEYGQYIVNQGQYESWIESVNDNPVFMDFESNGLVGIWELATDPNRQAQLKTAFETYAEAHGISLLSAGPIISNFADGDEGWTYDDYGNEQTPHFMTAAGYFGGYIVGDEAVPFPSSTVCPWTRAQALECGLHFVSPSKFSGDKTAYAGGTLQYYLWYSSDPDSTGTLGRFAGSIGEYADIVSENGNLVYVPGGGDSALDPASRPGNYAGSPPKLFVIHLTPGVQDGSDGSVPGQWVRWDGTPADTADIWNSLASIDAIRIWANYLPNYPDSLALDKVALKAPQTSP